MGAETTPLHPSWTTILPNDTAQDILGTLAAIVCFSVILYTPGYVAAHAANLFGFRRKAFAERSLWAIATSFCIAPIAAHLVGRLAGVGGLAWVFALCGVGAVVLLSTAQDKRLAPGERRDTVLLAAGWTLATLYLLTDLQVGHRLYYSVVMADQSYRIAFTDAVARSGVPPANPLYFAGHPAPMHYFYFWYVLCAVVMKLAHVSARQAFTASTAWAGFGLLVTVQLYTRYFFRWSGPQRWIAIALLAVNGADLIPALGQAFLQPTLNGNTEWWSVDPVFAWPDSLLWVPHHVASVLCCLFGFLLLWCSIPAPSPDVGNSVASALRGTEDAQSRIFTALLIAAAFASALGLSVYVAFGFALLLLAWLLRCWLLRHPSRFAITGRLVLVTVLTLLLAAPFLRELASGVSTTATSAATPAPHPFTFSVRRMIDSGLLTGLPLFAPWNRTHPALLDQAVRLALLVPGLALELGLFGAVLVFLLMRGRRTQPAAPDSPHATALFFVVCGLLLTLFVSSAVITNNDFGYRAVMLPQFFLLLLTAELLGAWRFAPATAPVAPTPGKQRLAYALLLLGIAGTAYWACLLRAWLPLEQLKPESGFAHSAEDNFQIRQAFETFDRLASPGAVVAFRPVDPVIDRQGAVMVPSEYYQRMLVMDTGRQMLNAEGKCATHFGGDPAACASLQAAVARLYASPLPSAEAAKAFCMRFGVSYLLISVWDPPWPARNGWPVTLPVVAQQPRFRIVDCR